MKIERCRARRARGHPGALAHPGHCVGRLRLRKRLAVRAVARRESARCGQARHARPRTMSGPLRPPEGASARSRAPSADGRKTHSTRMPADGRAHRADARHARRCGARSNRHCRAPCTRCRASPRQASARHARRAFGRSSARARSARLQAIRARYRTCASDDRASRAHNVRENGKLKSVDYRRGGFARARRLRQSAG